MGLLDRWAKKKAAEQLKRDEAPAAADKQVSNTSKTEAESAKPKKIATKKAGAKKAAVHEHKDGDGHGHAEDLAVAPIKGSHYQVIIAPLITEKVAHMESNGTYAFWVSRHSNKHQIAQAVKELYGVSPVSINVLNMSGKSVRFGKTMGRRSDYKKAFVTLPAGKTITVHENV